MKMKELTITPPEGYEVDKDKSTFEKIVFKEKKDEWPESWEDLKGVSGCFIDEMLALCKLLHLRERVYEIQNYRPDWNDTDKNKYCIRVERGKPTIALLVWSQQTLAFNDEDTAKRFLKSYRSLIEIAKPLL